MLKNSNFYLPSTSLSILVRLLLVKTITAVYPLVCDVAVSKLCFIIFEPYTLFSPVFDTWKFSKERSLRDALALLGAHVLGGLVAEE